MRILLLSLLLAGCATTAVHVPVKVEVPVSVPCVIQKIDKPPFAVDGLVLGSDIGDQMRALRAERLQRKGYEELLEAAIKACQ